LKLRSAVLCSATQFLTHSGSLDTFVIAKASTQKEDYWAIVTSLFLHFVVQCRFFSSHVGGGHQLVGVWSKHHAFIPHKLKLQKFPLDTFPRNFAPAKISHLLRIFHWNPNKLQQLILLIAETGTVFKIATSHCKCWSNFCTLKTQLRKSVTQALMQKSKLAYQRYSCQVHKLWMNLLQTNIYFIQV